MSELRQYNDQEHEDQDPASALEHLFTTEEWDDATDLLERLILTREHENQRLQQYALTSSTHGLQINTPLLDTLHQLRAERARRAIPAAALDAALDAADRDTDDDAAPTNTEGPTQ